MIKPFLQRAYDPPGLPSASALLRWIVNWPGFPIALTGVHRLRCLPSTMPAPTPSPAPSPYPSPTSAQFPSLGVFLFWETYGVVLEPLART